MKRIDIVKRIKEVRDGIANIYVFIRRTTNIENSEKFDLLNLTNTTTAAFDDTQQEILKSIGFSEILENTYWEKLFTTNINEKSFLGQQKPIFGEMIKRLETLIRLLDQEKLNIVEQESLIKIEGESDEAIISLIIPDVGKDFTDLERVSQSFEGVLLIYKSIATFVNENPDSARVLRFDSGSEKQYDLLGVRKVIEGIGDLFDKLWKNIAFYKEEKTSRKIDNLLKTISIYNEIGEAEKKGHIEKEQAERIRRDLTNGISKVLNSKTIIEQNDVVEKQKQLESFSPPLLPEKATPKEQDQLAPPKKSDKAAEEE